MADTLTAEQLAELRALEKAATPDLFRASHRGGRTWGYGAHDNYYAWTTEDAAAIAGILRAAPALLTAAETLAALRAGPADGRFDAEAESRRLLTLHTDHAVPTEPCDGCVPNVALGLRLAHARGWNDAPALDERNHKAAWEKVERMEKHLAETRAQAKVELDAVLDEQLRLEKEREALRAERDRLLRAAREAGFGPGRACQMPRLTEDRSRQMPCRECLPCLSRSLACPQCGGTGEIDTHEMEQVGEMPDGSPAMQDFGGPEPCPRCAALTPPEGGSRPLVGEVRDVRADTPLGECDWGGCDAPAVKRRWDGDEWLPVCGTCAAKPFTHEVTRGPFPPEGGS